MVKMGVGVRRRTTVVRRVHVGLSRVVKDNEKWSGPETVKGDPSGNDQRYELGTWVGLGSRSNLFATIPYKEGFLSVGRRGEF